MAYWLLKTEPDEFGIDDLKALGQTPEPWNGIRNYQARNLIRDEMAVDDLAFIYHSCCKQVGIAGIGKVVTAPYPDPDQFDPQNKYHDAKANPDNPRWYRVDIAFVEKLNQVIPLKDIKAHPELSDMVLVKQGRLSVQPVTEAQWQIINQMIQKK